MYVYMYIHDVYMDGHNFDDYDGDFSGDRHDDEVRMFMVIVKIAVDYMLRFLMFVVCGDAALFVIMTSGDVSGRGHTDGGVDSSRVYEDSDDDEDDGDDDAGGDDNDGDGDEEKDVPTERNRMMVLLVWVFRQCTRLGRQNGMKFSGHFFSPKNHETEAICRRW